MGTLGSSDGFVAGDSFSYMAQTTDNGVDRLALIDGSIGSDSVITGEIQQVEVSAGAVQQQAEKFTGTLKDDGTAIFRGIAPDGSDVSASLEEKKGTMILDKEPAALAATEWARASVPAFNSAVQDASRG